ncbi:transcriptional regulator [Mycolicibacterium sp. 3033]|nr:transcriptional regulator [Mycolicibacterium aurantiacum]
MTNAESFGASADAADAGMVRAGAAAAARRRELDISQRRLAAEGIINAGALIAFEKGRSWPRERTRAKLEEVLQWPPGTIERLRAGVPERRREPVPAPGGDESSLIAQAVLTAVSTMAGVVSALPTEDDPAFPTRISATLADLRQLEAVAAKAARIGRVTPPLIKALGKVRSLYDELMLRAARAPGAELGPRLYAARRGANLTVAETAQVAGVAEQVVSQAEAGEAIGSADAEALETLIAQIV